MNEVARIVKTSAQELAGEVLSASIIASLEKNPARNGVPIKARLPIVRQVVVTGSEC